MASRARSSTASQPSGKKKPTVDERIERALAPVREISNIPLTQCTRNGFLEATRLAIDDSFCSTEISGEALVRHDALSTFSGMLERTVSLALAGVVEVGDLTRVLGPMISILHNGCPMSKQMEMILIMSLSSRMTGKLVRTVVGALRALYHSSLPVGSCPIMQWQFAHLLKDVYLGDEERTALDLDFPDLVRVLFERTPMGVAIVPVYVLMQLAKAGGNRDVLTHAYKLSKHFHKLPLTARFVVCSVILRLNGELSLPPVEICDTLAIAADLMIWVATTLIESGPLSDLAPAFQYDALVGGMSQMASMVEAYGTPDLRKLAGSIMKAVRLCNNIITANPSPFGASTLELQYLSHLVVEKISRFTPSCRMTTFLLGTDQIAAFLETSGRVGAEWLVNKLVTASASGNYPVIDGLKGAFYMLLSADEANMSFDLAWLWKEQSFWQQTVALMQQVVDDGHVVPPLWGLFGYISQFDGGCKILMQNEIWRLMINQATLLGNDSRREDTSPYLLKGFRMLRDICIALALYDPACAAQLRPAVAGLKKFANFRRAVSLEDHYALVYALVLTEIDKKTLTRIGYGIVKFIQNRVQSRDLFSTGDEYLILSVWVWFTKIAGTGPFEREHWTEEMVVYLNQALRSPQMTHLRATIIDTRRLFDSLLAPL